jgi:hypothetical protein
MFREFSNVEVEVEPHAFAYCLLPNAYCLFDLNQELALVRPAPYKIARRQEPMVTATSRPFKISAGTTSTGWRSVFVA